MDFRNQDEDIGMPSSLGYTPMLITSGDRPSPSPPPRPSSSLEELDLDLVPNLVSLVPAAVGSHPFFLSSLLFSFLFLSSSSSPASSSSHLFFTAAVARPVGEGRPNPTRRCPNADGGHCPGLGPGESAGTPLGLNQYAGAGLAPVLGEGLRWPSPLPLPP